MVRVTGGTCVAAILACRLDCMSHLQEDGNKAEIAMTYHHLYHEYFPPHKSLSSVSASGLQANERYESVCQAKTKQGVFRNAELLGFPERVEQASNVHTMRFSTFRYSNVGAVPSQEEQCHTTMR